MANSTAVPDKPSTETTRPAVAFVGGKRGIDLLHDPVLNKATAYTEVERQALGLVGVVPDVTESEDLQLRRVLQQLADKPTDRRPSSALAATRFPLRQADCSRPRSSRRWRA